MAAAGRKQHTHLRVYCVNCAAFRKLSLTCHPDRNSKDPKAPERFQLITKAKEFLSDEVRMILLADILY